MISQGVSARIAKKVRRPRGTPAERRAVEPIFGWMTRRRRGVPDHKTLPNVLKAIVDVAMGVRHCAGSPIVGPSRTDPDPRGHSSPGWSIFTSSRWWARHCLPRLKIQAYADRTSWRRPTLPRQKGGARLG